MKFNLCGYQLDGERFELRRDGARVAARPQVLHFVTLLADNRDRVVTHAEIEREIWPGMQVSPGSMSNLVFEARSLLGDDGRSQSVIRTVRGAGYRLIAPVEVPDRPSTPERSNPAGAPFVGRGAVLAQLDGALSECFEGRTRIVLIPGEPGIGKTRTIEEFAARTTPSRPGFVIARCVEADVAPAFWPWIQILRACLGSADRSDVVRLDQHVAEEIARLTSENAQAGDAAEGEAALARFRRFDAVARALALLSEAAARVLVIEDLHRADTASLQLLEFVAETCPRSRLLVIATFRDTEAARSAEFAPTLTRLVRMEASSVVPLQGLERDEVAELANAILVTPSSPALARELHEHTAGNPFFIHQVTRLLVARDLLRDRMEGLDLAGLLGAGVREAILQHVARLSSACRALLARTSVIGREAPLYLIERLLEADTPQLGDVIREALDARVVLREGDGIRFAHALIRDALYESLDDGPRARLHGAIGTILERVHGTASQRHTLEIAHHYLAARTEGFAGSAIRFQGLAARVATDRLAYEDAVQHRQNALLALEDHAPNDDAQRCDLQIELGAAQMRADDRIGGSEAFRHAIELAGRCHDGERLARAALGYSPGLLALEVDVVDDYLLGTLELAVEWTDRHDSPLRARLLGRLAMALSWTQQAQRRRALAEEAIAVADRLGEPGTRAFAICARVAALWGPDDAEIRLDLSSQAIALARQAGDREQELVALVHRITSLLQLGRLPVARAEMAAFAERARALRQPHATWWISLFLAQQALMHGDFDATMAWTRAFSEEGRKAQDHNAALCSPTVTAFCDAERGEVRRAFDGLTRFVAFDSSNPQAARRATLALYAAWAGDLRTAQEELSGFAGSGFAKVPRDMMWIHTMGFLAETAAVLADAERAAEIYDLLAPLAGQYVVTGLAVMVWRPVSYLLGRLASTVGRHDLACTHFENAIEECRGADMLAALAFAHRGLADALERRGTTPDGERARACRDRGRSLVAQLAMRPHAALA